MVDDTLLVRSNLYVPGLKLRPHSDVMLLLSWLSLLFEFLFLHRDLVQAEARLKSYENPLGGSVDRGTRGRNTRPVAGGGAVGLWGLNPNVPSVRGKRLG